MNRKQFIKFISLAKEIGLNEWKYSVEFVGDVMAIVSFKIGDTNFRLQILEETNLYNKHNFYLLVETEDDSKEHCFTKAKNVASYIDREFIRTDLSIWNNRYTWTYGW